MSDLKNCWEVKNCGREPGGRNVLEMGVCPAPESTALSGINGGENGGRVCWAVAGTFCNGTVQGMFALKIESCLKCEFFKRVSEEEGDDFRLRPEERDLATGHTVTQP